MAQFDLHRLGGVLVVDLQTDLIGLTATRLVAPLRPAAGTQGLPGLTPAVEVGETAYLVLVPEMAAVAAGALGKPLGSLAGRSRGAVCAIDVLTHGF